MRSLARAATGSEETPKAELLGTGVKDADEAMKLTAYEPAEGIVSWHELPDFVRFVAAEDVADRRV